MKLLGTHRTTYRYDVPVSFGPHLLYLRPREDSTQRLNAFEIALSPAARVDTVRDPYDNALMWARFSAVEAALEITTTFSLVTQNVTFGFLLTDYAVDFPFVYEPPVALALQAYLIPPLWSTQAKLREWSAGQIPPETATTVQWLTALNAAVFQSLNYRVREEIGIQASLETLESRSGSCRDYAVLLVELCRTWGLAARFVSGYLFAPPEGEAVSTGPMHAWVEVYLPGAGWVAFDPTHGRACDETYVPVAHAAQADLVNPIQGAFFGSVRRPPVLATDVRLERVDVDTPATTLVSKGR